MDGTASLCVRLPRLSRELQSLVASYGLRDGLQGPDTMVPGRCGVEVVDHVLGQIGPVGGSAYAAMRAWNLLIWQPVLVGVLCAEAELRVAEVDVAAFRIGPEYGCHLAGMPGDAANQRDARIRAAEHIRRASETIFEALTCRVRLRWELAQRQMADRVLGILARRAMLGLSSLPATEAAAVAWLDALDLRDASSLDRMTLANGNQGIRLCRRSCCLEYKARPDFLCATCPKRTPDDRVAQSQKEWESHVCA